MTAAGRAVDIDISSIYVRKAITEADYGMITDVRWEGYRKYFDHPEQVVDQYDRQANATVLLAHDGRGDLLGTMRLLDSRLGKTEVERFLPVHQVLAANRQPYVEATRFSVPHHPLSTAAKIALQKTYYLYCIANQINTMLIWVRMAAAREYRSFNFQDIGEAGAFQHPLLGGLEHHTLVADLEEIKTRWTNRKHPLLELMLDQHHPNLQFD